MILPSSTQVNARPRACSCQRSFIKSSRNFSVGFFLVPEPVAGALKMFRSDALKVSKIVIPIRHFLHICIKVLGRKLRVRVHQAELHVEKLQVVGLLGAFGVESVLGYHSPLKTQDEQLHDVDRG